MTRILLTLSLLLPACGEPLGDDTTAKPDAVGSTDSTSSTGAGSTTAPDDTTTGTDTAPPGSAAGSASADDSGTEPPGASTTAPDDTSTTGDPGSVCGDGIKQADEECDDANPIDGDGCLSDCTKEWFVFVTSDPYVTGDLKGITGADYECRHRATKMFLPNGERYMAWISTSDVQPVDRLYHARGPYKLVNGLRVAANWDALLAGPLENPILVTEHSETNDALVLTGTTTTGERVPDSTLCDDWTDSSGGNESAWYGASMAVDGDWTLALQGSCAFGGALYCFEQP